MPILACLGDNSFAARRTFEAISVGHNWRLKHNLSECNDILLISTTLALAWVDLSLCDIGLHGICNAIGISVYKQNAQPYRERTEETTTFSISYQHY